MSRGVLRNIEEPRFEKHEEVNTGVHRGRRMAAKIEVRCSVIVTVASRFTQLKVIPCADKIYPFRLIYISLRLHLPKKIY